MKNNLYMTRGIANGVEADGGFAGEMQTAIAKFLRGDWGDTCKEDQELNEEAKVDGSRIVAQYITSKGNVFIITEVDRTVTTVLFADEY